MSYKENRTATVIETIVKIKELLVNEELNYIKEMPKEKLISLHMSFGMWIRNTFGLWGDNEALLQDTKMSHPDDASFVIIEALWNDLNSAVDG